MSLTNLCHCQIWCYIQDSVQLDNKSFDPLFDEILSQFFFSLPHGDIDGITCATLCYWINFEVFIYHAISFLFSHHYLFLTELETWYLRDLLLFGITDHWWVIYFLSLCSKSILLWMHSNHVQNQSKVSVNPAEELRIQPFKWWSP